jgi:hypothetical protein
MKVAEIRRKECLCREKWVLFVNQDPRNSMPCTVNKVDTFIMKVVILFCA